MIKDGSGQIIQIPRFDVWPLEEKSIRCFKCVERQLGINRQLTEKAIVKQ